MKMKTNKRDRKWMRNRNQLKNRKVFNVTMVRNPDGSFHMLGNESKVLVRKNQHRMEWANVDTRDLATELRNSRIVSR
jgi:hypothetical protein